MSKQWWTFPKESTQALTRRLIARGMDATLIVYKDGDHLTVDVQGGITSLDAPGTGDPINDSHVHPP